VNQGTDPVTPALAGRMIRCGVDLIGLDMLQPGDPRLAAQVWSWARGEPSGAAACSVQRFDGRWAARPCTERHRVACRDAQGDWFVPAARTTARAAPRICASARVMNGVPRTGFDGQQLRSAMRRHGSGAVWLGQRRRGSAWARFEKRGCGPSLTRPAKRRRVRGVVAEFVVRLRFACTGERLRGKRRMVVYGGVGRVRSRTGTLTRVLVAGGTRRLIVRFRYLGKRRSATVLLRR
jgi:hypothetical protein